MLTKYRLAINGIEHDLAPDTIKNWDEIECAYKRDDYSGAMRSFSSKFEFVNEAYDLLLDEYLSKEIDGDAKLTMYVIDDKWQYQPEFSCTLDFSSVSIEGGVLSISCLDTSIAAVIKAHKSTKYEFEVGKDVPTDHRLLYDRVTMVNTFEHTMVGDKSTDSGDVIVKVTKAESGEYCRVPMYECGDTETYDGNPISSSDEDYDSSTYMIKAESDCSVNIRTEMWSDHLAVGVSVLENGTVLFADDDSEIDIVLSKDNSSGSTAIAHVFNSRPANHQADTPKVERTEVSGVFRSLEALNNAYPTPSPNSHAVVKDNDGNEYHYITPIVVVDGSVVYGTDADLKWEIGTADRVKYIVRVNGVALAKGDVLRVLGAAYNYDTIGFVDPPHLRFQMNGKVRTQSTSRGDNVEIDTITPQAAANAILAKMCNNDRVINVSIRPSNGFTKGVRLIPAECIRGITKAKYYSTFKDFCEWMRTVFGMVYRIGDTYGPFTGIGEFYSRVSNIAILDESAGYVGIGQTWFCSDRFIVYKDGQYYAHWDTERVYNDPSTGRARRDIIFEDSVGTYYRFDGSGLVATYYDDMFERTVNGVEYHGKHCQDIEFLPMDELYLDLDDTDVVDIDNAVDVNFSIDNSLLYSTVEIGYSKQDYNKVCGRDEFNFGVTYHIQTDVTDKKLSMKSPYRADCYGFEFLAQERSKADKDDESDDKTFFTRCVTNSSGVVLTPSDLLKIDRSTGVYGAFSDAVFNGWCNPLACLESNKGFIAAMKNSVKFEFASAEGNTDISIGGRSLKTTTTTQSRLFTAGKLSFSTDKWVGDDIVTSGLISVRKNGLVYTGYVAEVKMKYAREEQYDYELIVKTIEAE